MRAMRRFSSAVMAAMIGTLPRIQGVVSCLLM